MTASGGARLRWICANALQSFALFRRKPRVVAMPARLRAGSWRAPRRIAIGAAVALVAVVAAMIFVDAWAAEVATGLPEPIVAFFDWVTDFGKSVRLLVPIALLLAAIAVVDSPTLGRTSRGVLAALGVRLGFLFAAVALPGLVFTIVKRLIGRARPLVEGGADPFIYHPLGWSVEYASFPSGHATDAFAIATAVGALWPRTRPVMWTYAVLIALSRIVLTAHFPSDVIAGAVVGTMGALIVRDRFAARGLAFSLSSDGTVRPFPGPSWARIKGVARQLIAP